MSGKEENVLYHEKQSLSRCAVHAVNNLLGRQEYGADDFDEMCYDMTEYTMWKPNPHKSFWGVGNYDVQVIMTALMKQGLETVWFDKRKGVENINLDGLVGMIVNEEKPRFLFGKSHHWWTVRRTENGKWWNLDSKNDEIEELQVDEMLEKLNEVLESEGQLLLVGEEGVVGYKELVEE